MINSNPTSSFTIYVVSLCFVLSLSLVLLFAWLRVFLLPRIKEIPSLTLELPQPIEKNRPFPIPRKQEVGFALGVIIIYLLSRFIGLVDFPIYFFSDEAAQTVLAEELVEKGFRIDDEILPTYFYNIDKYSLSVSVYLQVIPYLLFGKSIWITRGTSVLVTLVGALSIGLILKQIFQTPYWWLGVLIFSVTPAWFLHSRTAFETSIATAFYGGVLYAYLLYLYRSPKFLLIAVFMAAITFYSYNSARLVIIVTVMLFAIMHFRFHMRNWKCACASFGLAILFALPYLRFQHSHLLNEQKHLALLNSYWTGNLQFAQKMLRFGQEYLRGFSVKYWYSPHVQDLYRHVMKGYGHFLWLFLPFLIVGIWWAIKNWRTPAYQVLLIALVSAPVGGALVESSVTRSLFLVMPITLLTTIGIVSILGLIRNLKVQRKIALVAFAILGVGNIAMLIDVLSNGPLWFDDYGLYGMQYGGRQVFQTVNDYLLEDPTLEANISPHWLNGPEMVMRFFVDEPNKIRWISWMDWVNWEPSQFQEIMCDNEIISLATSNEWEYIENTRSLGFRVLEEIPYPDGSIGFVLFKLPNNGIQPNPACTQTGLLPDE